MCDFLIFGCGAFAGFIATVVAGMLISGRRKRVDIDYSGGV